MTRCSNGWEFVEPPFAVRLDDTLTKNGYAANAKSVGIAVEKLNNKKEDKQKTETQIPDVLESNTSYFLNVLTSNIVANFPFEAELGDIIQIVFQQGQIAQNIEFNGPLIGLDDKSFTDANSHYEVMGMWDGTVWVCLTSKIEIQ